MCCGPYAKACRGAAGEFLSARLPETAGTACDDGLAAAVPREGADVAFQVTPTPLTRPFLFPFFHREHLLMLFPSYAYFSRLR